MYYYSLVSLQALWGSHYWLLPAFWPASLAAARLPCDPMKALQQGSAVQ